MYPVSEKYKAAMKSEVQQFRMTGTIGDTRFNDQNLLRGSFSIVNQCSGNDLVSIGQVYVGELNSTFINVPIERYSWKGKVIRPVFGQRLEDGTYEDIPLGVFTIDSTNWTESGVVIKAYDNMAKLDRLCGQIVKNGTAYEIALIACTECGVELGNSEEEFASFPNGQDVLSEYEENDVETWRDLLSWLSQTLACFVTADRDGKIVFRQYSQEVVDTIGDRHRFKGAAFSDYVTRYTGLSCVNIAEKTTSYYGFEIDDGLTYNLGSNPFLQYGVEETLTEMRRAILDALQMIHYVPFKAKAAGNPAYDLGDVIIFSGGIADGNQLYCITKYSFKYNGDYEMAGVGENPALANARSKSDKDLIGLMSEVENQGLKYYVLRNVEDITVENGQNRMVFPARFAVAKESHVRINVEILLTAETEQVSDGDSFTGTDLICTVSYYLDGVEMTDRHPVETYQDGQHILTLQYDVESAEAMIHTFDIWLQCKGGSVFIEKQNFYEVIFGDGLAAQGAGWDGTIDAYDEYDPAIMDGVLVELADSGLITETAIETSSPSEAFSPLDLGNVFSAFSESIEYMHLGILFSTAIADSMVLEGVAVSGEYFTGTGTLTTNTVTIHKIDEVLVDVAEGTVLLAFSFDAGRSWYKYEFGEWVDAADGGMSSDRIGTVHESAWMEKLTDNLTIRARLTQAKLKEIFVYTEGM